MMERRIVLAGGIIAVTLMLGGCEPGKVGSSLLYIEPIRYRLTATVETPQGVKTGYSVIEVTMDRALVYGTVRGEAVAVDLPNGQAMFVLLRTASNPDWALTFPGVKGPDADVPVLSTAATNAEVKAEAKAQRARQFAWLRKDRQLHYVWGGDVPKDRAQYLPYFVRFKDIKDPKSVEALDPDNLTKTYGAGYALKSLTVQMTGEAVTTGIAKRFSWWKKYLNLHFDDTSIVSEDMQKASLAAHLTSGSFSTEFLK